jgi:hypothetical protein
MCETETKVTIGLKYKNTGDRVGMQARTRQVRQAQQIAKKQAGRQFCITKIIYF